MRLANAMIIGAGLALLLATAPVHAGGKRHVSPGGEFSFQVESAGSVLPVYNHRGTSYVEGQWGQYYAIRVFNHTAERIEAVVTVDGRDVISGKIGNFRNQRGYVIDPYGSVRIDGFRRSWNNVASFQFTGVENSYSARMGDASNVGVIGVAVFKERPRQPVYPAPYAAEQNLGSGYGSSGARSSEPRAKKAPSAEASRYDSYDDGDGQGIGTGYGSDTYSPATQTRFTRRSQKRPDALLAIRYDDRQGLIAKGVLPRPHPYYRQPQPNPNPFPASPGFAPPPPPPPYYSEWE